MMPIQFAICSFLVGIIYVSLSCLLSMLYADMDIFNKKELLAGFLTVPLVTLIGGIMLLILYMLGGIC